MRILHVEDSALDSELFVRQLRRCGLSVDYVRVDTERALQGALSERRWDAVISDFALGTMNGFLVFALVRASDATVPFFLFTGDLPRDVAARGLARGMTDVFSKDAPGALIEELRAIPSRP